MDIETAKSIVKPQLTNKRYEHTIRVAQTAAKLSQKFGGSKEKAELAAIFHDYAKYQPPEEMKRWILHSPQVPKDLLQFHHELWHGPVAALLMEREHGITDKDVLNAVFYHTTGRTGMTKLELIIFLADYIEPGRSFPGLDDVRQVAETDLLKAAWMASRNTIAYLLNKGNPIYPDTFYVYNDLTKRINGGNN
ncbi:bis(5'-nucleosyl)-tetraphosphatase (symmetrical) YqeK [Virgibacillus sp. 179-BFC.A HS]|uniref:bis(5'-nucleosyl)-tetraphosphatase (symmetrical) n=1 Tax=Tigheibacillus jepli TaxID=3035914 RepID=A0ABU5CGQ6_9BACI|nr:bis(5'-nucleosyl)-tetraphosphatase (symmetrical) YqeK [Virgibacillus sp. 179-BFC.A HS]MDY0405512.1 bis(5'-nucleosyl)-tetraphosphatase (symmetrical) YqeK [Virgibacillus sp. 179-BFC.A HS]